MTADDNVAFSNQAGEDWDYIIVGAGAAGCVVASRLSENAGARVLVLNAGAALLDTTPLVKVPAGAFWVHNNPWFSWRYQGLADASSAHRAEHVYAGKVLGGGSSVNGMMFIRGNPRDYDDWFELGYSGWSYEDVLPFFRKMEKTREGARSHRGETGPIGVSHPEPMLDISHRFIEAAIEAGVPFNPDINGPVFEGVGRTPSNIWKGVRQSTAHCYLRPATHRRNLRVLSGATVSRVVLNGKRAEAVEFWRGGRRHVARAAKEIILCAGAIRSPQILMLSGIGGRDELHPHGIPHLIDLPRVGRGYMDHVAAHMVLEVSLKTWTNETSLQKQLRHGLQWLATKKGAATAGVSQAVAFVRTRPELERPNVQLTFIPLSLESGQSRTLHSSLEVQAAGDREFVMVYVSACKASASGSVALASADPFDAPKIQPALLSDRRNLTDIVEGIGVARRIMRAEAIRPYVVEERYPGADHDSEHALEKWVRESSISMAHPSGTCAMGAVVDADLQVKGVANLRVADASIMPTIPSGNINAPTIMIGERAAHLIAHADTASARL